MAAVRADFYDLPSNTKILIQSKSRNRRTQKGFLQNTVTTTQVRAKFQFIKAFSITKGIISVHLLLLFLQRSTNMIQFCATAISSDSSAAFNFKRSQKFWNNQSQKDRDRLSHIFSIKKRELSRDLKQYRPFHVSHVTF